MLGEQLFQYEAKTKLDQLLNTIAKGVNRLASSAADDTHGSWLHEFDRPRHNNTIFIGGERGAGKTTFLRAVMQEYFKNKNDKILPITIIDPTLVETHQHLLVDLVAKLNALLKNQLSCCGDDQKYCQFNEKLEAMAEGLKLLNSGVESKDQDAAWFLNKSLKHAMGGQALEARFHELIDSAASALNQDIFIVAFDDVDTDTSKAYDALELIRKYLTHQKLVILISGDLKLYSYIVKEKKGKEFNVKPESTVAVDLVDHLEQQYLAKILPVEQRIKLKSFRELADERFKQGIIYVIDHHNEKDHKTGQPVKTYIETMLSQALNLRPAHVGAYRYFILSLPVRTTLQILKAWAERPANDSDNYTAFKTALRASYIGALQKEGIDADSLISPYAHPNRIGMALFTLCHQYGDLETGFYDRPDAVHESYNASQIFLSSVIASYTSDGVNPLGKALSLMLTGGAASNIYMNHVAGLLRGGCTSNDYLSYIGLQTYQDVYSVSAHFSPIILNHFKSGTHGNAQFWSGVIRTPRQLKKVNKSILYTEIEKLYNNDADNNGMKCINHTTLPSFERSINKQGIQFMTFLASKTILFSAHSAITANEGRDYISIYCLIASTAQLLGCQDEDAVKNMINKLEPIKTYGSPTFLNNADVNDIAREIYGENENENDIDDIEAPSENYKKLINILYTWIEECNKGQYSSLLIGKVWTRLMYSLSNINGSKRKLNSTDGEIVWTLYDLMANYIWKLVNSVLIEEVRFGNNSSNSLRSCLNMAKNTKFSSNELKNNLNNVFEKISLNSYKSDSFKENLPLTTSLIACPLLLPYLLKINKDNKGVDFISDHIKSILKSVYGDSCELIKAFEEGDKLHMMAFVSALPIVGAI
ncbi:hypothetical protein [Marinagarivorans algicola]|uniref:hypothetical protein n=1 Tax=Marinagarivorans algicola TaxID=1513270 RepID=UPI0006B5D6BB|nr:hypothetical protein [Marinagarivorans algicola]